MFLVVFRSGRERLLAMIPSVFALLVTFLGLRVAGGSLNVATIIIATTVLGTTENDQLHFFHHMHERAGAPLEIAAPPCVARRRPRGRVRDLINAVGFLGLADLAVPAAAPVRADDRGGVRARAARRLHGAARGPLVA